MAYTILVYSAATESIKDFFIQTRAEFTCITTTSLWEDLVNHMEVAKPDAFLIFCEQNDEAIFSQIKSLRGHPSFKGTPVFITGTSRACDNFERKLPGTADLIMAKPTSPPVMEQNIKRYLDSHPSSRPKAAPAAGAAAGGAASSPANDIMNVSLDDLMRSFGDAPAKGDGKKHIIVVDDDRSVLKLLKSVLSEHYEVSTMISGNMAIKYLETHTADLILLDYEMPIESGPEIFKKLKQDPADAKIPVVFLTGVADTERIKDVIKLGPQGYLLKPIDMNRLKKTIVELIG